VRPLVRARDGVLRAPAGLSGARYDAVDKLLHLEPRIAGDFRSFLATATGYGTRRRQGWKAVSRRVAPAASTSARIAYTPHAWPIPAKRPIPMPLGELLLRATAWTSLVAWAASEWARARATAREQSGRPPSRSAGFRSSRTRRSPSSCATAGAMRPRSATPRDRPKRSSAGRFGGGLFVNYFFLALWTLEAAWWWLAPASYRAVVAARGGVRAFFLFMFLNGAVVFAHGPLRALGAAAVLLVAWSWYRRAGAEGDSG
jgi:hypothetical protein